MNISSEIEPIIVKKEKLINDPIFFSAVFFYTFVMVVGFFNPEYGLFGLFCVALISIFKILIKNFTIIAGMIILGLVCIIMPFLLIIYIPLIIYFLLVRLSYFIENWQVVLVGLLIYFFPIFILIKGMNFEPILILLFIPIVLFPIVINYFYKKYDYTLLKILELFSEAPILIISIILPFTKLNFSTSDVHATPTEAISAKPIGDVHATPTEAISAKPIGDVHATPTEAISAKPIGDVHATPTEAISAKPISTSNLLVNHNNSDFNLSIFNNTLFNSDQIFVDNNHENINKFGDKISFGIGSDKIIIEKGGLSSKIIDTNGNQLGLIEDDNSNDGILVVKDKIGNKVAEIELLKEDNKVIFKDIDNKVIASIDHPNNLSSLKEFMKTDVDKIEENSNDMKVIHQSEESTWELYQEGIGNTLILVTQKIKNTSKSNENTLIVNGMPLSNWKPYNPITFSKYIEKNCSNKIRSNDHFFFPNRFNEISDDEWEKISEKYKVLKDDIAFIASSALVYKGSNGFLITKNDVIFARELGGRSVRHHISKIAGIKKSSFPDLETRLDNNKIFIINFNEMWMKPVFKELNELFINYRKLNN